MPGSMLGVHCSPIQGWDALEEELDGITAEDAKTGWKIVSFETDPFIPLRARLNVAD